MNTYRVYFRSELQWASRDIEANTPEQALTEAKRIAEERYLELYFENFSGFDAQINEIEVCDPEDNTLAEWLDNDLRLRLAAADLFEALKQALQALNTAPRFQVRHLGSDSYKIASLCQRAIAKARGQK